MNDIGDWLRCWWVWGYWEWCHVLQLALWWPGVCGHLDDDDEVRPPLVVVLIELNVGLNVIH